MNQSFQTYRVTAIGSIIFLLFLLSFAFYHSIRRTEECINMAFRTAIKEYYNQRLLYISCARPESLSYDVFRYIIAPPDSGKVKNYTLKSRDKGKLIITLPDSIDKETGKRRMNEYLFSQIYPIKPDELNTLFHKQLYHEHIAGATGVVCYTYQAARYSTNGEKIPPHAYTTPRYTLDIAQSIRVQAWVDYDPLLIIKRLNPTSCFFILLILLLFIASLYLYRSNRKGTFLLPASDSISSQGIIIDLNKQTLHINGCLCSIQKLDLTLLDVFCKHMGQCVSREQIQQIFWPTDNNANEKIDTHIKAIRKVLKDFPDYQLVTVRGKGYYLERTTDQKECKQSDS